MGGLEYLVQKEISGHVDTLSWSLRAVSDELTDDSGVVVTDKCIMHISITGIWHKCEAVTTLSLLPCNYF